MSSPLGFMEAVFTDRGLAQLSFRDGSTTTVPLPSGSTDNGALQMEETLSSELESYFAGDLKSFSVPLDLRGSDFQLRVWDRLQEIPFGSTTSYGLIAQQLGDPKSVRAVARANALNPVAILVPCHRVIGRDGSLTGYAGGLWRKRRLLLLEATGVIEETQASLFTD
ncbi:MAG: methylated-DNA--[protein]-cysteine S-methyltransferase [Rhodothermia bacterium]|nr:methylated-DNA--[protein]-cysteine S-methyltransferase [Rhodothermia bacterium]